MDTAAAAQTAAVTAETIRHWARMGAVKAAKSAGRWIIDAASLARRIAIGAKKEQPMTTGKIVTTSDGSYAVRGDADALAAAYETGAPVTPTQARYAQDRLYLGDTRETYGDYGRTLETRGLAYTSGSEAVYYIDMARLDGAPALAAALQELQDEMDAEDAAMARADDEYLNPRYM